MSTPPAREPHAEGGEQSRRLLAALSAVMYGALAICAFGYVSLLGNAEVLPRVDRVTPAGALAMLGSTVAVFLTLLSVLKGSRPGFSGVVLVALLAPLAFAGVFFAAGVLLGGDPIEMLSAAGEALIGWAGVIALILAAGVGFASIALRHWQLRPSRQVPGDDFDGDAPAEAR